MTESMEATEALCRSYRATGDRRLRNEIVERHIGLADHVSRRYLNRGVERDDLRQIALLAMIRSVDRYDPDREASFTTFAGRAIDGEIKRWFRDRTWSVRPPRRVQELHLEVRQAADELLQQLRRSPTVPELAEHLDISVDDVLQAVEAGGARHAVSTDPRLGPDEGAALIDSLAMATNGAFDTVEDRLAARELLTRLTTREREVIVLRYLDGRSQQEIAEAIGVSQSYASRLIRAALDKLGAHIESDDSLSGVP
jgi:RNA polymerase sigma-B factor